MAVSSSATESSSDETGEKLIFGGDVIGEWGKESTTGLDASDSLSVSASSDSWESLNEALLSSAGVRMFLARFDAVVFFLVDFFTVDSFSRSCFSKAVISSDSLAFRDLRFPVENL